MRITATIMATAVLLAAPATADAIQGKYGDYPLPTTVCDGTNGTCWTLGSDYYTFDAKVYDLGKTSDGRDIESVGATFKQWHFPEHVVPLSMKQGIGPMREASWYEVRFNGVVVDVGARVNDHGAYTGRPNAYCNIYRDIKQRVVRVGIDSTPDEIMAPCEFVRRSSDPLTQEEQPTQNGENQGQTSTSALYSTQPVGQAASLPIPRRAASCGKVRGKGRLVAVRSLGASCKGSKLVVARYARALKQPRGWRCHVAKKQQRVRCVRTVRAKARAKTRRMVVYGLYVRRS